MWLNIWNSVMKLFLSPEDTELDAQRKKAIVCFALSSVCVSLTPSDKLSLGLMASWPAGAISIPTLIYLFVTKRIPIFIVLMYSIGLASCILLSDYGFAQFLGMRHWPASIIVIDLLLICQAPKSYTQGIIIMVLIYLLIDAIERGTRFGFYQNAGLDSESVLRVCDCEDQPCPVHIFTSFQDFLIASFIFLLDFAITRGFAEGMQKEQQKLKENAELTEKVVECMVRFDLDLADEILEQANQTTMKSVLRQLLCNLEVYRPYLPTALFEFNDRPMASVSAPGVSGEDVAIVFTDIKSSSLCWETAPEAMARALRSHNSVIGQCINDYHGYEVKTIGDSFMIAFASLVDACSFGLSAQVKLMKTSWPSELLEIPICMPDSSGEWCGLRVRIGIAWGEAVVESQRTSDKFDYFGPVVNQAARIEGACIPGSVSISDTAYDLLLQMAKGVGGVSDLLLADCIEMPAVELRGIGRRDLWTLVPSSLPMRCLFVRRMITGTEMPQEVCSIREVASTIDTRSDSTLSVMGIFDFCMDKTVISIAQVSVPATDGMNMNQGLQKVITSLERTSGIVMSVVGTSVVAAWNVSGRHDNHIECCFKFVHFMSRYELPQLAIGASNGTVSYGKVGAVGQRFVTAIGTCVPLSRDLCSAAHELGVFCLYASTDDAVGLSGAQNLPCLLRPVDSWSCSVLGDNRSFLVQQVSPLPPDSKTGNDNEPRDLMSWEWSSEYWEAFQEENLIRIEAVSIGDPVLTKVLKLLSTGGHLQHSLVLQ
eukprot:TRINITY_DN957_c0_g1_i18.p1 TRINITY_DN957_c0_g1~~TRINITY_DN957_c0_g1_i18.p1  ORF type:complete len:767 (+),score=121.47 TRINITY_DN957_c0_g1_i18:178-2478(+)